jgi:deazaflavin-dependent oxidoreductase (nitroreductase family)
MPVLELTTVGRRSGRRHSVLLTSPVQDGATLVVVASRGGDDRSPAWFLNLQDNPEVEVTLKGAARQRMRPSFAPSSPVVRRIGRDLRPVALWDDDKSKRDRERVMPGRRADRAG